MPIRDILWACPACDTHAALRQARRGVEACHACGASFQRGTGSEIVASYPDGRREGKAASDWMASLPARVPTDQAAGEDAARPLANAQATIRDVVGYQPIHSRGEFLNQIERLGVPTTATIELYNDGLKFRMKQGTRAWPLLELSALGSSSGNLQLRRGRELMAVRLHDASTRWWEERLRHALREAYRRAGRGEIVEFQPRIVTA